MPAESVLWREIKDYVRHAHGGRLKKVEPAGDNGFPDGIILIPGCPVLFAEFKAPRGKLSSRQTFWRDWLLHCGFYYSEPRFFEETCQMIDRFVETTQKDEK